MLQVTPSDVIIENITTTKLEHAGAMFLFLVSCFEQLDPWYHFYADLLQNQPLDFVLLTLNRILKSDNPNQNKDLKLVAQKLFKRVGDLFSLKYPKIYNLTNGIGTLSWKNKNDWTSKTCNVLRIYHNFLDPVGSLVSTLWVGGLLSHFF